MPVTMDELSVSQETLTRNSKGIHGGGDAMTSVSCLSRASYESLPLPPASQLYGSDTTASSVSPRNCCALSTSAVVGLGEARLPTMSRSATSPHTLPIEPQVRRLVRNLTAELVNYENPVQDQHLLPMQTQEFCAPEIPSIPINAYVERMIRYFNRIHQEKSNALDTTAVRSLLVATTYLHKLCELNPDVLICPLSCHRLFFIAFLVAERVLETECPSMEFMAKVSGIDCETLTKLEKSFCKKISYNVYVSPEELTLLFEQYCTPLRGANQGWFPSAEENPSYSEWSSADDEQSKQQSLVGLPSATTSPS